MITCEYCPFNKGQENNPSECFYKDLSPEKRDAVLKERIECLKALGDFKKAEEYLNHSFENCH